MTVYLHKEEEHQFLNIDKQEYDLIIKYLGVKKIKVKSETGSVKLMDVDSTTVVSIN